MAKGKLFRESGCIDSDKRQLVRQLQEREIAMSNRIIVERLARDSKFRAEFFAHPRRVLLGAGIEVPEDEIKRVEHFDWDSIRCQRSVFDDEEVLRCSVE